MYDDVKNEYKVIQESNFYNEIFAVLDNIQKKEFTPERIIKSVKFWNYLTTIISAKNKSCPRFPITIPDLEKLYNDTYSDNELTLTRDTMVNLTVDNLEELRYLVDDFNDEPIW